MKISQLLYDEKTSGRHSLLNLQRIILADTRQNVQIDCFPDGIVFFQFIQRKTPNKIAFVDIFMEKMNGIAVAEKLRRKRP